MTISGLQRYFARYVKKHSLELEYKFAKDNYQGVYSELVSTKVDGLTYHIRFYKYGNGYFLFAFVYADYDSDNILELDDHNYYQGNLTKENAKKILKTIKTLVKTYQV